MKLAVYFALQIKAVLRKALQTQFLSWRTWYYCRGYKRGGYDGTFGLIPCCSLLSHSLAKCAALEEVRYCQWFQQSGKKIFFQFPTLLFYAIAHYDRNITLAN